MNEHLKYVAFTRREDEPHYALLPHVTAPERNRYGKPVQLVESTDPLAGRSLNINGATGIGENPDRYKQHGFYFNADNCISCHACESACSEKNDLPPHLAFRSVGYVEGGTWPNYQRLNISMACNHCDDPVCLKGCPTRAYTKFAEYGAVLQDPDICFGCGYCTWVCPYNAPQLDPVKGRVEKCNMCVDRLEVGLKPACASACLAGALDFGVVETLPENREQLEAQLPGFPTPEITHPNIRFQQTRSLPREMRRPDSMPIVYTRDEQGAGGGYVPKVKSDKRARQWGLAKLSSRENPLVIFTLLSQASIGAFVLSFLATQSGITALDLSATPLVHQGLLIVLLAMQSFGLLMSTIHLGKPMRFYRGFNNLRYSPVSREAATLMVFFSMMGLYFLSLVIPYWFDLAAAGWGTVQTITGWLAAAAGPVSLYFMHRIYRIKARPFWNHWQVLTSFYGTMLALGAVVLVVCVGVPLALLGQPVDGLLRLLMLPLTAGLMLEGVGLWFHARYLRRTGGEAEASQVEQTTTYGKTYLLRNIVIGSVVTIAAGLYISMPSGIGLLAASLLLGLAVMAMAIVGRALFYVLVIPTTMPGAFFWRNRGFQEHARQTGLAEMPQVGIVPDGH